MVVVVVVTADVRAWLQQILAIADCDAVTSIQMSFNVQPLVP